MKRTIRGVLQAALFSTLLSLPIIGQTVKRTAFDVTNYIIDASITPASKNLSATADVTFTPTEDARTIAFELNGSLKVETITRLSGASPVVTNPARVVKPPV